MNKNLKIGFIGCGKMASAIINGVISSKYLPKENLFGSEANEEIAKNAQERLGIKVFANNKELTKICDIIFVVTKPNYVKEVLEEIKDEITSDKLLVSIPAGFLPKKSKILSVKKELFV